MSARRAFGIATYASRFERERSRSSCASPTIGRVLEREKRGAEDVLARALAALALA